MKRKPINVIFTDNGPTYPHDVSKGVLLENGKVFVADSEGMGVYNPIPSVSNDFVFVDVNTEDFQFGDTAALILDLVLGANLKGGNYNEL